MCVVIHPLFPSPQPPAHVSDHLWDLLATPFSSILVPLQPIPSEIVLKTHPSPPSTPLTASHCIQNKSKLCVTLDNFLRPLRHITTNLVAENHTHLRSHTSRGQKSNVGPSSCVPSGGSRGEAVSGPFPAFRSRQRFQARAPFLHLPNWPYSIFTSLSDLLSPSNKHSGPPK